jgi:hypothetical protein
MNTSSFFDRLTQDVAPLGTLHAPLLSWLGSIGLLIFFAWHIIQLSRHTAQARQPFQRLGETLAPLVQERQRQATSRFPHHRRTMSANGPVAELNHRDGQDLQRVDTAFRQEPLLAQAWNRYRQTLVTEQVPWYVEPRIFSSRAAQDLFALDALFSSRINLAWYGQVPALLTGFGLLLTFVALLIGLSKLQLHTDGHTIVGIQGLINGLAGKFLTSIIGLLCANLFTFIEKPAMFRLLAAHQTCMHHLDELFPRKTLEQLLEGLHGLSQGEPHANQFVRHSAESSLPTDALTQPIRTMTDAMHTLTQDLRTHLLSTQPSRESDPVQILSDNLAPLIQGLTGTVERLTDILNTQQQQHYASTTQVNHLIDQLTGRLNSERELTHAPSPTPQPGWFRKIHAAGRGLRP